MKNVEEKLPKWVQKIITSKNQLIKELEYKLEQANKANEITSQNDWFTLGINCKENRSLFLLSKDDAQKICDFGGDTIILVGKPKNN